MPEVGGGIVSPAPSTQLAEQQGGGEVRGVAKKRKTDFELNSSGTRKSLNQISSVVKDTLSLPKSATPH